MTSEPTILQKLVNLVKLDKITANYPYNVIIFEYWKYYEGFGDRTLNPQDLTSCEAITRQVRNLSNHTPNLKEEERYRMMEGKKSGQLV